jgi:hypothetical protein
VTKKPPPHTKDPAEGEAETSTDATDDVDDGDAPSEAGADSPPMVPQDDGGIPAAFKRPGDAEMKRRLRAIFDRHLEPEWPSASYVVQLWFVTDVLGIPIVNIARKETPQE